MYVCIYVWISLKFMNLSQFNESLTMSICIRGLCMNLSQVYEPLTGRICNRQLCTNLSQFDVSLSNLSQWGVTFDEYLSSPWISPVYEPSQWGFAFDDYAWISQFCESLPSLWTSLKFTNLSRWGFEFDDYGWISLKCMKLSQVYDSLTVKIPILQLCMNLSQVDKFLSHVYESLTARSCIRKLRIISECWSFGAYLCIRWDGCEALAACGAPVRWGFGAHYCIRSGAKEREARFPNLARGFLNPGYMVWEAQRW